MLIIALPALFVAILRRIIQLNRTTPDGRQSKESTNADQKSLETVFSIAICRPTVGRQMAIENSVSDDF